MNHESRATIILVCALALAGAAATALAAMPSVRYSSYRDGLDLAGEGYAVRGDLVSGRFSFRTPDRRLEWVEPAVAVAVIGKDIGPWSLVRTAN